MATFSKVHLSGSTSGRPISVAATTSPGTAIHTAVAGATDFDEVWIYAKNNTTTAVKLTVEFGGVSTSDIIELTIQGEQGLSCVVAGQPLNGGLLIKAFCATTTAVDIMGYVNRITA